MLNQIKNFLKLFSTQREEAILTCLKNDIALTDENIREIESILKQKKEREARIVALKNRSKEGFDHY